MVTNRAKSTLADLVDLETQRQRDADADAQVTRRRDRDIAAQIDPADDSRAALLVAWIRALRQHDKTLPGAQVARVLRLTAAGLGLVGVVLGWAAAAGLLTLAGKQPINVVTVLAALVFTQVLLMFVWALCMAPVRVVQKLPILGDVHALLRMLNPGQLVRLLINRLPTRLRDDADDRQQLASLLATRYGEVAFLVAARLTQVLGICFNLGVVAGFLSLVTFTDLAFGWSTTLDITAEQFHGLTAAIAAPFAWLWPDAVPTRQLIEATRYFRISESFTAADVDPVLLGRWWKFLLASVITYGLLPRLLAWLAVIVRLRGRLVAVTFDDPYYVGVAQRLTPAHVSLNDAAASAAPKPTAERSEAADEAPPRTVEPATLLLWRLGTMSPESVAQAVRETLGSELPEQHAVRGTDFDADARAVAAVGVAGRPVIIAAKAWEAPARDLRNAIADLRAALGPQSPITVMLLDADGNKPAPPKTDDVTMWRRKLGQLGDAQVFVAAFADDGGAS